MSGMKIFKLKDIVHSCYLNDLCFFKQLLSN